MADCTLVKKEETHFLELIISSCVIKRQDMLQSIALTQLSASGRGSSHHDLLRLRRRLLGRGAAHLRRAAVRLRRPDH